MRTKLLLMAIALLGWIDLANGQATNWSGFEAAISSSQSRQGPGGGGGATQTTTNQQGTAGGGENEFPIKTDFPSSGVFLKGKTDLSWEKVGKLPYNMTLRLGRTMLLDTTVYSNHIVLDFSTIGVNEEDDYSLSIVDSQRKYKTNDIEIEFASQAELGKALMKLESDPHYNGASGVEKQLMKAYYLEQEGWTMEAAKAYDFPVSNVKDTELVAAMYERLLRNN